jgi:hypothetical protein
MPKQIPSYPEDPKDPKEEDFWYNSTEAFYKYFDGISLRSFVTLDVLDAVLIHIEQIVAKNVGLDKDGNFPAFERTNYLNNATNIREALLIIDFQLKKLNDVGSSNSDQLRSFNSFGPLPGKHNG